MKTGMIILAGGVGQRMGHPVPKQFIILGGKPIIAHVVERVARLTSVSSIVITCPAEWVDKTQQLLEHRGLRDRFTCVEGGTSRQDSVYQGMLALGDCESVIIHEAVRPFVTTEEFQELIDCDEANAIYGSPIPFTVLGGGDYVEAEFDRKSLINVQLPQKFSAAALREAHDKARSEGLEFTEDASLVFHYGTGRVRVLPGKTHNIKITNPSDLTIGEAIYNEFVLGRTSDS